jgi:F-type H+-transporting ATPase subunit b
VFFISWRVLRKWVVPAIRDAIDARANRINESIDAADKTRQEADQLLADYRERLKDARGQADEIIARARAAAEAHERSASEDAKLKRDQMMEQTRRDIEAETRRAIQEIRQEVADLTVLATEKVTRKTLNEDDQRRLIEDAMSELDFSALGATDGRSD